MRTTVKIGFATTFLSSLVFAQALEPEDDPVNFDRPDSSSVAVVLVVEIDGTDVVVIDKRMSGFPKGLASSGTSNTDRDSTIIAQALGAGGRRVGSAAVNDRRIYARDGELVVVDKRTISVVVPVEAKPEEIRLRIPGVPTDEIVSVTDVVDQYCADFPRSVACRN